MSDAVVDDDEGEDIVILGGVEERKGDDDDEGEDEPLLSPNAHVDAHHAVWQRAFDFHMNLHSLTFPDPCQVCNEAWPGMVFMDHGGRHVCRRCHRMKHKDASAHYFSEANNSNPMLEVPDCLKILTPVEESLIAIVDPLSKVIQLPYCGVGYSGHVCSFPRTWTRYVSSYLD